MYSTRIIQHHCKNFIVKFVLLIVNFLRILPRFDFSTKFALATYELLFILSRISHTEQNPDRQQPIKESSLKYYPFLLLSVSSLPQDRNVFG